MNPYYGTYISEIMLDSGYTANHISRVPTIEISALNSIISPRLQTKTQIYFLKLDGILSTMETDTYSNMMKSRGSYTPLNA